MNSKNLPLRLSALPVPFRRCLDLLVLSTLFLARPAQAQGDIIWDTEVTTTDVTNTSPPDDDFTEDAVDVTISYAFSSSAPGFHDSYTTYFETFSGTFGNETGYFGMQMDASTDDGSEWLEATFVFNPGIAGLSLTLLDVDLDIDDWRDVVIVTASDGGGNVAPTTTTLGGANVEGPTSNGDCSGYNSATTPCFRGLVNTDASSSAANVTLGYSATITQVVVHYIAGDVPSGSETDGQRIGIGDLSWTTTLPVELTGFTAQADGRAVMLNWETASETNNAGFEIQKISKNDGALPRWEILDFVEGHGTTLVPQQYRHRVEDLAPGRHRFRLKQIDYDGTFEYSPEVEVAVEMMERFVVEPAYPNPFNHEAAFRFAVRQSQQVEVVLYDVWGRSVKALYAGRAAAGQMQTVRVDGSGLPSGLYLIRVQGEAFIETQAVTLAK